MGEVKPLNARLGTIATKFGDKQEAIAQRITSQAAKEPPPPKCRMSNFRDMEISKISVSNFLI